VLYTFNILWQDDTEMKLEQNSFSRPECLLKYLLRRQIGTKIYHFSINITLLLV